MVVGCVELGEQAAQTERVMFHRSPTEEPVALPREGFVSSLYREPLAESVISSSLASSVGGVLGLVFGGILLMVARQRAQPQNPSIPVMWRRFPDRLSCR